MPYLPYLQICYIFLNRNYLAFCLFYLVPKKDSVIFFRGGVGSKIIILIAFISLSSWLFTPNKTDFCEGCAK